MPDKDGNQSSLVDRQWLETIYLPSLSGSVLFIGVQKYTRFYNELMPDAKLFTVDIDPLVKQYGSLNKHFVSDIFTFITNYQGFFNHISFNGMCGLPHLINDLDYIIKSINACIDKLIVLGSFQLGINLDTLSMKDVLNIKMQTYLKFFRINEEFICKPSEQHKEMYIYWGTKC